MQSPQLEEQFVLIYRSIPWIPVTRGMKIVTGAHPLAAEEHNLCFPVLRQSQVINHKMHGEERAHLKG